MALGNMGSKQGWLKHPGFGKSKVWKDGGPKRSGLSWALQFSPKSRTSPDFLGASFARNLSWNHGA